MTASGFTINTAGSRQRTSCVNENILFLKQFDYFVLFQRMSFSMPSKCLMDATWPSM